MSAPSRRGFFGMLAAAVAAPAVAPLKVEYLGEAVDVADVTWTTVDPYDITCSYTVHYDTWTMSPEILSFNADGTFVLRPRDPLKGQLIESE
jgi:hypothetical protein